IYWVSGGVKALTAIVSVLTAILLWPLLPKALALPSPAQLRLANAQLEDEIAEHKRTQAELARQTVELNRALRILKEQQETMVRTEKLAAVGQLAASVGHELCNPLAAVRNGITYISKRILDPKTGASGLSDPRVREFFGLIERELTVSGKIINDLLEF